MPAGVFRPGREGAAAVLGPLESEIIEVIWQHGGALAVPAAHAALTASGRAISSSAVKAVLNNLADKGRLTKSRVGKVTAFAAVQSREAFEAEVVASVVGALKRTYGVPAIAQLVREFADDEASLAEFERLIAQRRSALKE